MAKIAKAAGTEYQVVGKVFILYGTVQAVSPDGTVRVLAPNSPVYADEHIITGSDGSVSIQFDGPPVTQLDLGRMTEIVVDDDVHAGVAPESVSESAAEAEQVHQTLLEGDQTIELEATAAGGSTGVGGGHPTVIFTLDGNEGHITSGADTTGAHSTTSAGTTGGIFDLGVPSIPLVNIPVDTTPTNGSAINTELSVHAGDVISFSWSFDTDDSTLYGNDFGFVVVNGGTAKLADISQVGDGNATGWGTVTFTATETGTMQIGFGVMNTGDSEGDSHLLIDKLTVNGEVVQSFENGLTGWESTGNVTVVTSHDEGGGTPIDGTHMVQLTSTLGVDEAALQGFFHLPEGTIDSVSATRLGTLAWATADDEGLPHGNPGSEDNGDILVNPDPDYNEATFSGTLPLNFGPDGPGGVGFGAMHGQTGLVGIEEVTYSWDGADNMLTAIGPRGALFTVEVNPLSGAYTLTLKDNVLHDPPVDGHSTENNAYVQQLTYTVTDADGDHVNGTLNIMINDDMPVAVDQAMSSPVSGDLGSFGADGGHVESITMDGHTYTYNPAGEGSIGGLDGGQGTFDTTTNTLTVTFLDNSLGKIAVDMDDGKFKTTITGGDANETIGFTLIDGDGDSASAQLSILIDDPTNNT
jgi:hypothetical protein